MKNEEYLKLVEHRNVLVELSNSQIVLFDKSTLAISTGALGLSILFLDKVSSPNGIFNIEYLVWSWMFLLATILLNIGSYLASWSENRRLVRAIDRAIDEGNAERLYKNSNDRSFTLGLNCLCLLTFPIGVILLAAFALNNLERPSNGKASKPAAATTSPKTSS